MLRRLGETISPKDAVVKMKDASYPKPFPRGLEYNAPVHGNWNIVHTGMQVPEAIQIYVCADNCMRGVVLTAAEMNAADHFSFVIVEEKHILNGNLEDITIEGVTDVLNKRGDHPKAVLLFTVCLHHFLGSNLKYIYGELERRFPDICFIRCYMDPIMQKHGLTPDQKLRKAMYDPLPECEPDAKTVSIFGSDFALDESSDIKRLLRRYNYTVWELPGCKTWQDLLDMSKGSLFLTIYPAGKYGMEAQARRLGRKYLYLPGSFNYEEIERQLKQLTDALGLPEVSRETLDTERAACEEVLAKAKALIKDMPVALDYLYHPRPLGLAKLLLTHGFHVKAVYLDAVSPEEKPEFDWLQEHAPELELIATIQVKMRVLPGTMAPTTESSAALRTKTSILPGDCGEEVLAIGQKAAYFSHSRHFVNLVQGEGLYGFDGIRRTAELMMEAYREEKNTEKLVVQKGWGCECCL